MHIDPRRAVANLHNRCLEIPFCHLNVHMRYMGGNVVTVRKFAYLQRVAEVGGLRGVDYATH
jgi:hypothetical protein